MGYCVVKADLKKDKEKILAVWEKNSPGVLSDKFDWIYKNNPIGLAHVWMIRHDPSGEYVGVTAIFSRKFLVNGSLLIGGIAGDLLVNQEHRAAGPAVMLQKNASFAIEEGVVDFIYGFPNKAAEPILKRIGYVPLGDRVRLVKVIKTAFYISKLTGSRYVGMFLGPLVDLALRVASGEVWGPLRKEYICEEVQEFDGRFEQLWKNANVEYPIVGERGREYLQWKFVRSVRAENKILAVFDLGRKNVEGYLIYRHQADSIEIRDLLIASSSRALNVLIACLFCRARYSRVTSINLALLRSRKVHAMLRKFGFIERKDPHRIYLRCSDKVTKLFPAIWDPEQWCLFQSDDDM